MGYILLCSCAQSLTCAAREVPPHSYGLEEGGEGGRGEGVEREGGEREWRGREGRGSGEGGREEGG